MPFDLGSVIEVHGIGAALALLFAFGLFLYWRQRIAERSAKLHTNTKQEELNITIALAREAAVTETRKQVTALYERLLADAVDDREALEVRLTGQEQGIARCTQRIETLEEQLLARDKAIVKINREHLAALTERDETIRVRDQKISNLEQRITNVEANHDTLLAASAIESELLTAFKQLVVEHNLADTAQLNVMQDQATQRARYNPKGRNP